MSRFKTSGCFPLDYEIREEDFYGGQTMCEAARRVADDFKSDRRAINSMRYAERGRRMANA